MRHFIRPRAAYASAWVTPALVLSALAGAGVAQTHTHGQQAGWITPHSALIWTRASTSADVSVLYGTDPGLAGALETGPTRTQSATDFTAKITVTSLQPGTQYYYATRLRSLAGAVTETSPIGRFRTAPAAGTLEPLEFVCGGDINSHALYGVFPQMQSHAADLYLHLGDMPYADGANTVPEYHAEHRAVRGEPRLEAFLRTLATHATWDDHEVENDWDRNSPAQRVTAGRAAWKQYFPIPANRSDIYHSLQWGDTAEIFVLDTRTYRGANADPDVPGRPFLGFAQSTWLQARLASSTAVFKIIATSVPLRFGTTAKDSWEGYLHERRRIFDFIEQQGIDNVVWLTADQHWGAAHEHPEGMFEFQTGPLATSVRTPPALEPELRWVADEINFGRVVVDPAASPPTLTMEWHGASGLLRRQVVDARSTARLRVLADVPEGGFATRGGPFYRRGSGRDVRVERLPAGGYELGFDAVRGVASRPARLALTLPEGAEACVAADWLDVDFPGHDILLEDAFDGPLIGWSVRDSGSTSGPSAWFTDGGLCFQSSNIHTPNSAVAYPGTTLVRGDVQWTDYSLQVRAKPWDDDGFGVLFRYTGAGDYYRYSLDRQRGYRRLVSCRNGVFRTLAEDTVAYDRWVWQDIEVVVVGDRIRVISDGETVFDVTDADHARGAIGLYTWANYMTAFDDLIVRAGDATLTEVAPVDTDQFSAGGLAAWTVLDEGTVSAPSNWTVVGGVLQQTSNIYDGDLVAANVPKLGSTLLRSTTVADFEVEMSMRNSDNDALGMVFRWVDATHYYRFSMDSERGYRRLVVRDGVQWITLWEDQLGYVTDRWYRVAIRAVGSDIELSIDGEWVASVADSRFGSGRCGPYVWGSDGALFDDFVVRPTQVDRAVLGGVLDGQSLRIKGMAPGSANQSYALAMAGARVPGIPLDLVQTGDSRTIELTPDGLFWASLGGGGLFQGFAGVVAPDGAITAQVDWPVLPILTGLPLFVGGWAWNPNRSIGELLPTIETRYP